MAPLSVPSPRMMILLLVFLALPLTHQACHRSCSCPTPREVHCTFRHLTSIPKNLPKDTERVNIGYNSIQAVGVLEFTDLQRLEMLMLHGNDIMTVSPGAFNNLRSLQILKLSYNKLKTIKSKMFEGLTGLVRLHLDHNLIEFVEPFSFDGLASLKLLQLEGNLLKDLHPHTFVTLSFLRTFWSSNLRHLHLADNQLEYLLPETLQHLEKLELLSLHDNPWTCDCQLRWLLEWNTKHNGVIKCKKDRDSGAMDNCGTCSSPQALNGSQIFEQSTDHLSCRRATIKSPLRLRESPRREEIEPDLPRSKDLEFPLGRLTFVLSDSHANRAHVLCSVKRPAERTSMVWQALKATGQVSVNVSLTTLLECEIDRDELQRLWRLVAYYYESPAILERGLRQGATIQANTKHGQRFEVLKNGTFMIKNVQLQDRGQYLCTAQNKFGTDRIVITLAVLTQPPKIVPPNSADISVYFGRSLNLECSAEGKPKAQISWILPDRTFVREPGLPNSRAILLSNGTLSIQAVNFSSKGDYKCIASNAAGADTVTYHIHIVALPPTIKEISLETIIVHTGRSMHLHCTVKGEPTPVIKWRIPSGAQIKPSQFLGSQFFVFPNGTLFVRSISLTDSGKYECSASNALGAAKRVVQLNINQELPRQQQTMPQRHRVSAMYGSTVYLHCPKSTNTMRGALWRLPSKTLLDYHYSPERSITAFPNGTLRILQLTEKDGGTYVCMFQKPNGEDMETFQVEVLMKPPKIASSGSAQKRVTYGESFQVDCVASGLPDPELSWSLPDGTMINNALQSDDSGARSRRSMFENGTLLLQQMGKTDEGDYTCFAKNKLGEDEMKVSVRVVADSPRILFKDQATLWGHLNQPVYMKCEAQGDPPPTIIWLSPTNEIISSSSSRYQVLGDGTLVIRKLSFADRGKYACVARNSAGDDIKNVNLEVEAREPQINGQSGRTTMKVLAVSYQTTLLDCKAEGMPEPQITWTTSYGMSLPTPYLGGRFQVHRNGSLELRGLRKTDEGRFECLAKNNLGEARLEIQLEVAALAEKPIFLVPNIEVLPLKVGGRELLLECQARGKPLPEFVWVLPNSTVLTPGTKLQRFLHYPSNGTLRISNPVTSDKGIYRCLAKNVAGQAEKRYILEPGRRPQIRGTSGSLKVSFGQNLNLPCSADGWPQATISWTLPSGLVLDKPQTFGRATYLANGTLQLRETTTLDRGTYICKAINTFGSSSLSYPVTVMVYPPRITNAPPSITRVSRGSPVKLSCVAADQSVQTRIFKIIVIGDSNVGKTCLTFRFTGGSFPEKTEATIGVDFREKAVEIEGEKIKVQVWDTAGQERFRKSMVEHYYRNVHAVVFVYDVTKMASFQNLKTWIQECNGHRVSPAVPRVLVGNKCDLVNQIQVPSNTALKFADAHNMLLFETSAKDPKESQNVDSIFMCLACRLKAQKSLLYRDVEREDGHVRLTQEPDAKNTCPC
ncbi:hypothetical protein GJAV_G00201670 [Gymnothorax javanicus]|nr:hypothetical protein GJAV_G00201670 [Gymnothorax javanicus]